MAEELVLDSFTTEDKENLQTMLECAGNEVFDIHGPMLYLPFAFARLHIDVPSREITPTETAPFTGKLRVEQVSAFDYAIDKLTSDGHVIISARPGFGKTITAVALATKLKAKTLIVVNKLILIDQWVAAISTFSPEAVVRVVKPSDVSLDGTASFYVVNAINLGKKPVTFWESVKFLIVDELHQIVTAKLVVGLLRVKPDAVLGLSATPYRHDEYNAAIKWFFGENVIGEALNQAHTFRVVPTGYVPENIQYTPKGLDWGKILEDQAANRPRNECIVKECLKELASRKTVLVLVKRVAHADALVAMIKDKDPSVRVATLVRSERTFDKECKVLVGTTSKIGVGFDHSPVNCLVVASDIKNYFVQFLGRCMRNPTTVPSVVDFKDNFSTLRKHLADRIKEYKAHGGKELTTDQVVEDQRPVVSAKPRNGARFGNK